MAHDEDPLVRPLKNKEPKQRAAWLESAFGGVAWALGLIPLQEWAEATPLPTDREKIREVVESLDEEHRRHAVVSLAALLKRRVPPNDCSPAFDRGYRGHDRVMRAILLRDGDGQALLHAMMEHDADSLRLLLKFPPSELLDPEFRGGFEQANRDLAKATRDAVEAEAQADNS